MDVSVGGELVVINAKNKTNDTSELLAANLRFMINNIDPLLAEWNDDHVLKYLEVSNEISQRIAEIIANLDRISDFCGKEVDWIRRYLNT